MLSRLFIRIAIILSCYTIIPSCFPAYSDIDKNICCYRSASTQKEKINIIMNLLNSLSNPMDKGDDEIVRFGVQAILKEYRINHDEAILIAIDGVKIDAGFANFVCEFYGSVMEDPVFIERLRNSTTAREATERCIGIAFSEDAISRHMLH